MENRTEENWRFFFGFLLAGVMVALAIQSWGTGRAQAKLANERLQAEAAAISGQGKHAWTVTRHDHDLRTRGLMIMLKDEAGKEKLLSIPPGHRQFEKYRELAVGKQANFLFAENQDFTDPARPRAPTSVANFLIPLF